MRRNLKAQIGKYIFEIFVIFIGITLSFLFEEWRTNRNEREKARQYLVQMHEEAEAIKRIVSVYDSTLTSENKALDSLLNLSEITNEGAFNLLRISMYNRDFSLTYKIRVLPTLKATGEIDLIDGHVVSMLELIQVAADKIEGIRFNNEVYGRLVTILTQKSNFFSDVSSGKLTTDYSKLIISNQEIKELMRIRAREKRTPAYNLNLLKERTNQLIEMVDGNLQ